jgi:hypothetical protein
MQINPLRKALLFSSDSQRSIIDVQLSDTVNISENSFNHVMQLIKVSAMLDFIARHQNAVTRRLA